MTEKLFTGTLSKNKTKRKGRTWLETPKTGFHAHGSNIISSKLPGWSSLVSGSLSDVPETVLLSLLTGPGGTWGLMAWIDSDFRSTSLC